mgnify:CR=1 FL=1
MIEITTNSEIKQAIFEKKPIVALESTIISHGLPFPENYNTAIALEEEVRRQGSIPATIAIIAGKIKVGLEPEDLNILSDPKSLQFWFPEHPAYPLSFLEHSLFYEKILLYYFHV